jgi:hypothetical protein
VAQNKGAENLCETCGKLLVTLDKNGDAHYCLCWSKKLNKALKAADVAPSKKSTDFLLAPKLRDLETGKPLKGVAAEEAAEAWFSSKGNAFPKWDAKGRSEAEKEKLRKKQSKEVHAMFKEGPGPESATLKTAALTEPLKEKLREVGLTSDETDALLMRFCGSEKTTLKEIAKEFGSDRHQNGERLCNRAIRKIKKAGLQEWLLKRVNGEGDDE